MSNQVSTVSGSGINKTKLNATLAVLTVELTSWHFWSPASPAEPHVAPPTAANAVVVPADEDQVALDVAGHAAEGSAVRQGDNEGKGDQVSGHHFDLCLGPPEILILRL